MFKHSTLTLDQVHAFHSELRDHARGVMEKCGWQLSDPQGVWVALKSLDFGFNTYKAINVLIPLSFYEQGCGLLRILWETAINWEWVCRRLEERARLFAQYTVVESRRLHDGLAKSAKARGMTEAAERNARIVTTLDEKLSSILDEYRSKTGTKKEIARKNARLFDRFTAEKLGELASELGEPWLDEYRTLYPALCCYTHASPSGILFPSPMPREVQLTEKQVIERDRFRTVHIALCSMAIFERLYTSVLTVADQDDLPYLEALAERVPFRTSVDWAVPGEPRSSEAQRDHEAFGFMHLVDWAD